METKTLKLADQWVVIGGKVGKLSKTNTAAKYESDATLLDKSDALHARKFKIAAMSVLLRCLSKSLNKAVKNHALGAAPLADLSTANNLYEAVVLVWNRSHGLSDAQSPTNIIFAGYDLSAPITIEFQPSLVADRVSASLPKVLTHFKIDWLSLRLSNDVRTVNLQGMSELFAIGQTVYEPTAEATLNQYAAARVTEMVTKNQKVRRNSLASSAFVLF